MPVTAATLHPCPVLPARAPSASSPPPPGDAVETADDPVDSPPPVLGARAARAARNAPRPVVRIRPDRPQPVDDETVGETVGEGYDEDGDTDVEDSYGEPAPVAVPAERPVRAVRAARPAQTLTRADQLRAARPPAGPAPGPRRRPAGPDRPIPRPLEDPDALTDPAHLGGPEPAEPELAEPEYAADAYEDDAEDGYDDADEVEDEDVEDVEDDVEDAPPPVLRTPARAGTPRAAAEAAAAAARARATAEAQRRRAATAAAARRPRPEPEPLPEEPVYAEDDAEDDVEAYAEDDYQGDDGYVGDGYEDGYDDDEEYEDEPAPPPPPVRRPPRPAPRPVARPAPRPAVRPAARPPVRVSRPVPRPAAPAALAEGEEPLPAPAPVELVKKERKPRFQRPTINGAAAARAVLGRVGQVAQLVFLVLAVIVVLGVLFVISDANLGNDIVKTLVRYAGNVVGPFRDVFTEDGKKVITSHGHTCGTAASGNSCAGIAGLSKKGVIYNWGLAAVVYLIIGSLVRRIFNRI